MNCPTCRKTLVVDDAAVEAGTAALPEHFPFCSERCRLVDFGRWASGAFRIPGGALDAARDAPSTELDERDAPL
jgi:uncharacterized protein